MISAARQALHVLGEGGKRSFLLLKTPLDQVPTLFQSSIHSESVGSISRLMHTFAVEGNDVSPSARISSAKGTFVDLCNMSETAVVKKMIYAHVEQLASKMEIPLSHDFYDDWKRLKNGLAEAKGARLPSFEPRDFSNPAAFTSAL